MPESLQQLCHNLTESARDDEFLAKIGNHIETGLRMMLGEQNNDKAASEFSLIAGQLLGPKGSASAQPGKHAPRTYTIQCSNCGANITVTT